MRARILELQARLLPHGLLDVLRQVALFLVAYYGYSIARGLLDDPGSTAAAFQHGRDLINVERSLGVFVEPAVNAWAEKSSLLAGAASWAYLNVQFSVTIGALVYLYLRHNASFYFVRNMFMAAMAIALVVYIAFPTAPPRFFPEWGFKDSVAQFTGVGHDSVAVNALVNPYAAVPSMHVAFSLMIGIPLARLVKPRPLKVFWACYPLLVTFVIVATANHFLADAFFGACTAALAAATALQLAKTRPQVWAFARESHPTAQA
jgi:hypothetical protein